MKWEYNPPNANEKKKALSLQIRSEETIILMAAAALLRRSRSRKNLSSSSSTPTCISICSSSVKEHVFLHDWWLIKTYFDTHGKRLGIGGFTSKESLGIRCFLSASIVKRHDAVTLQTADGITVMVRGHLNRSRTLENGFPLKVCSHFVFGFPYYWEEFSALSFDGDKTTLNSSEHVLLDDFPVTISRDISISTLGDHENCMLGKNIFDDILQSIGAGTSSCDWVPSSIKESSLEMMTMVSTPDEALGNQEKRAEKKRKGSTDVLVSKPITPKQRAMHENSIVVDSGGRVSGPLTRSRSRLIMKCR